MDEVERLKGSKPGDQFIVGFRPGLAVDQELMTVESNDGQVVVLAPALTTLGEYQQRLRINLGDR